MSGIKKTDKSIKKQHPWSDWGVDLQSVSQKMGKHPRGKRAKPLFISRYK